ncbi:MAG: hypothetical protein EP343_18670 [Deltaproteobacteria bacterium]|nr:MAG: hypothetical protein EP343_18670 [Deltaproteobacteria bacterium]
MTDDTSSGNCVPIEKLLQPELVLALDGGPSSLIYTRILLALEDYVQAWGRDTNQQLSLIDNVTMIAGTSAGSFVGCYLAYERARIKDPLRRLKQCIDYTDNLFETLRPTPCEILKFLSGFVPVHSGRTLKQSLEDQYGDTKISDISDVQLCVTGLQVKEPMEWRIYSNIAPVFRSRPMAHNTALSEDETTFPSHSSGSSTFDGPSNSMKLSMVDLMLRSSAFPMMLPIHKGSLDGGMFANNPSMDALTLIIQKRMGQKLKDNPRVLPVNEGLRDVHLLSLGGQSQAFGSWFTRQLLKLPKLPWGWCKWMLNPFQPAALLDTSIVANVLATNAMAQSLLDDQFMRVAHLELRNSMVIQIMFDMLTPLPVLQSVFDQQVEDWVEGKHPNSPYMSVSFKEVTDWLHRHSHILQSEDH